MYAYVKYKKNSLSYIKIYLFLWKKLTIIREFSYYSASIHEVCWLYDPTSGLKHHSDKTRVLLHSFYMNWKSRTNWPPLAATNWPPQPGLNPCCFILDVRWKKTDFWSGQRRTDFALSIRLSEVWICIYHI